MDRSEVSFSDLTSDQLGEVKALESKLSRSSHTDSQETILIAYTNPVK